MQEETTTTGTAIAEYSKTEAALSGLREKYEDKTYDVATKPGMVEANAARGELRGWIKKLETTRVEIKAPALDRCRDIDKEAHRIEAELRALEGPIHAQIKEETGRVKREKEAAEKAEFERLAEIKKNIDEIERLPLGAVNCPSVDILTAIEALAVKTIDKDGFGGQVELAETVLRESLRKLKELHESTVKEEEGRAELARLRAEQDERDKTEQARVVAESKALAEAQAESRRKIEDEERAARDHIEKERIKAEADWARSEAEALEKRLSEEQEAKAERDRLDAEDRKRREETEAAERASRERIEKEGREAREKLYAEVAEIKANRAAEAERLQAERDKLEAEQRAAQEAREAEQAAKEETERKEREAAEAVEREKQRAAEESTDGRQMLALFVDRFGALAEFSDIAEAITEYLEK